MSTLRRPRPSVARAAGLAALWTSAAVTGCAPRPAPHTAPVAAPLAVPPLPELRHGHRAECLADGRILVFGGFSHGSDAADRGARAAWLFDPAQGAWARAADLHHAMAFHASTTIDGVPYAIGGAVERYDARADAWEVLLEGADLPESHGGAAAHGRRIYAAGGFKNAVIDVDARTHGALAEYPGQHASDHFAFVAVFDGALHVVGGLGGEDFQPRTEHFALDLVSGEWRAAAPLPQGDAAKFAAHAADARRLYVFGLQCAAVYDSVADRWEALPAPPWEGHRVMPACCLRDGVLYVLGGLGADGRHFENHAFDTVARRWVGP